MRLREPPIWPAVPQRGVVPEVFAPVAISTMLSIKLLIQRLTLASKSALIEWVQRRVTIKLQSRPVTFSDNIAISINDIERHIIFRSYRRRGEL